MDTTDKIDISSLESGVYILKANYSKGSILQESLFFINHKKGRYV